MEKLFQLTKEQAIKLYASGIWKNWTHEELFKFQLYQDCLCVPFDSFHEAAEKTLERSVWSHEFAFSNRLKEEYKGKRLKPTFEDIVNLIPEEKCIILMMGKNENN